MTDTSSSAILATPPSAVVPIESAIVCAWCRGSMNPKTGRCRGCGGEWPGFNAGSGVAGIANKIAGVKVSAVPGQPGFYGSTFGRAPRLAECV